MHDGIDLISTLAVAFGLALLLGFLAERIKLPALLGYADTVLVGEHELADALARRALDLIGP